MGGKASLYMVLGFSLIFTVIGYNFTSLTRRAVANEVNYYYETMAHDITVSGANLAGNKIFFDQTWKTGYNNLAFNGGTINVNVTSTSNKIKVVSVGEYGNAKDTVIFWLQPSAFSKFAYYMNIFPGDLFFYTGDTISGPFHTQKQLRVKGSPVFWGKASAKLGLVEVKDNPKTNPIFNGGFEGGIDIPYEWDPNVSKAAAYDNGMVFANPSGGKIDVKLVFNADATVTYKTSTNGGSTWTADSTKDLATLAPNGVIFIDKGNVYLQGTVNGKYTVVCDQSSGSGTGNVYLENDIVYHNSLSYDPTTHLYNVNGSDMLGIVCSNNIVIKNNAANSSNINIHAAMFSYKGGLTIEDPNHFPAAGSLRIVGSLSEYQSQTTGILSGSSIIHGYSEKIYFDERFKDDSPPYYPTTGKMEIVSWYETTWIPSIYE